MNTPYQQQVFDYLCVAGPERKQALADLIDRGFFSRITETVARVELTKYLDENPRGFCSDGITRARQALLKSKTFRGTATIEFDIEFENPNSSWRPRPDSSSSKAIASALDGYSFENANGPSAFRNAKVIAIQELK